MPALNPRDAFHNSHLQLAADYVWPHSDKLQAYFCTSDPDFPSHLQGYEKAGELAHALSTIEWGTDYLLKCDLGGKAVVAQVGLGQQDHNFWRFVLLRKKFGL
jgi:hypothetical protein